MYIPDIMIRILINTELTRTVGNIRANASQGIELIFISKITYLFSSRVVVVSQPASVRVRQDVLVPPSSPPHSTRPSMVWKRLPAGRSGSVQCWPVEGTNTSTSDLRALSD